MYIQEHKKTKEAIKLYLLYTISKGNYISDKTTDKILQFLAM